MNNDKIKKHQFSADRPVTSCKEDLLGRSGFAESLASAIKDWTGNDSLVITLYGPWGSGKSSIKNMVLEFLHTSVSLLDMVILKKRCRNSYQSQSEDFDRQS